MESNVRAKDRFSSNTELAMNAGFQSVSQLSDGSTPHSGQVQLMVVGSVGFVSPWTALGLLCGPTCA